MDALHLSNRLAAVASFIPEGARLADIGSDHAYLPANLLLNHRISFAIAGEVAKGPLENAKQEINLHHLEYVLKPRLADGLAAVAPDDKIDTVSIAGMGGRLIAQILTAGHLSTNGYKHLVLQPNIDIDVVRRWLADNHYQLVDELVLLDDGHYYEILVAEPGEMQLTDQEFTFGPFNLTRRSESWLAKWQREFNRISAIMQQLAENNKQGTDAYQDYAKQLQVIGEAIEP
jgi:tRNA (adenine22-N1)-methyltransferase